MPEKKVPVTRFVGKLRTEITRSLRTEMTDFAKYIRKRYLTGGTKPTKLAVRTGKLRASLRPAPILIRNTQIETGINVGTVYGAIHFGPAGSTTEIKPKVKQWLTIPLDAAKTKAGVARGRAADDRVDNKYVSSLWGETFVQKSKKGNLIIFGKRIAQKGASAGQTRGDLLPLFVLKKSVKIPARVDPRALAKYVEPKLIEAFRQAVTRSAEG